MLPFKMEVDEGEIEESRHRRRSRSPRRSQDYPRSSVLERVGRAHGKGKARRRLSERGEPRSEGSRGPIKCEFLVMFPQQMLKKRSHSCWWIYCVCIRDS